MSVLLVGDGPALATVRDALDDVDATVTEGTAAELDDATLGVVVAPVGDDRFLEAATAADRWIGVELGGVGGHDVTGVDAAVAGFGPTSACYRCLQQRVAANLDDETADGAGSGDASAADAPSESDDAPGSDDAGASADGTTATQSVDDAVARLAGAVAGREAVRLLAGDDRISGRVVELPHARRAVLPVPGCACDPTPTDAIEDVRSLPIPREYADRPVDETAARMERAIDDRVGIVRQVGEVASFPAPYYLATLASTTGFSDGSVPTNAAGVDDDWNAALVKAVGESLERYGAAIYRSERFERAPPADLADAVPPAAFAGAPADALDADASEPIPWVEAEALDDSGERVWVPASAVHFPPPPTRSLPGITTGLGLGSSPVGALLAGLTEVIERDAAMVSWYSTFEPLGLSVDDPEFDRLARRARGEGLTVTPMLVTQDVDVPVVSVAVHREDEWPRFAVASAAALDPVEAATGALVEAIQNWMELRSTGEAEAAKLSAAIGEYAAFPEPAREFVDVDRTVSTAAVAPEEPTAGTEALDRLVAALDEADLTGYAARLTTRDLDELGFEAVRVVVPEAQPLFTGAPRFGERAERVPEVLGFEPRLDRDHHPYP